MQRRRRLCGRSLQKKRLHTQGITAKSHLAVKFLLSDFLCYFLNFCFIGCKLLKVRNTSTVHSIKLILTNQMSSAL